MSNKAEELFNELITYIEDNAYQRYWLIINPAEEMRNVKFVDLYKKYKEESGVTG